MAYSATGTAGNDTLNQFSDTGPGTIVGLSGDDCIIAGSGAVQAFGNSGNDSIFLQPSNTGSVFGGSENDFILGPSTGIQAVTGPLMLFGDEGSDTISVSNASAANTVVGGHDSSDGGDFIATGTGADLILGNGGNDTVSASTGANTVVAGFGNDNLNSQTGSDIIFGNQGNDTISAGAGGGSDSVWLGQGNDLLFSGTLTGASLLFGNEGDDTIDAAAPGAVTIVGGDGNDNLLGGSAADILFGNTGNDTVNSANGSDTVVGGQGDDSLTDGATESNLAFGNEGNDTIAYLSTGSRHTVFGGVGNDSILTGSGPETLQGNEGNDTIAGAGGLDTISGGSGNDVFAYADAAEDGNNAAGGGPVEFITDVDFAADKFDAATQVTFAANMGPGTGADLNASANNAIAAAFALAGNPAAVVAAQFTFGGRTYLAINQDMALNAFLDGGDLLLDITGATGAIGTGNFI